MPVVTAGCDMNKCLAAILGLWNLGVKKEFQLIEVHDLSLLDANDNIKKSMEDRNNG